MKSLIILFALTLFSSIGQAEIDTIKSLSANGIPITGIDFSDLEDVGVCWGGDGSIWKTVDKINWVPAIGIRLKSLQNVEAINPSTFIAITNSHVFLTRNGGGVWDNITNNLPAGIIFTKVRYINQCIYILGKYGKVFKSSDLGLTWADNSLSESSNLVDIAFFDNSDNGYLISSDLFHPLWETNNGGVNWESQSIHQDLIGSCITISGKNIYIAGLGNMQGGFPEPLLIILYEAGWEAVPLPESYSPLAIAFNEANGILLAKKSKYARKNY